MFPRILLLAVAAGCAGLNAQPLRLDYDFAASTHGFEPGFADYPSRDFDPGLYRLEGAWKPRPANLGSAPALFIGGSNRSDDLFMFWKKRITGLAPATPVRITIRLEFASNYAEGMVGIGGAPAEAVTVKAGAAPIEPLPAPDSGGWWRMNIDKGNQSAGGADMEAIGHIGKPDDGTADHALIRRHTHGQAFTATTAEDGSLWLAFGSDSGFEGRTEIFYTRLTAWIDTAAKPGLWIEHGATQASIELVWNSNGQLQSTTDLQAAPWENVAAAIRPHPHPDNAEPKRFWRVAQTGAR